MATYLGHWALRGYGNWAIEEKASGALVGYSGLWNPEGWPEPEMMWGLAADAHGRGYATEAARRARAFAYRDLGWTTLIELHRSAQRCPRSASRSASAPRYERDVKLIEHCRLASIATRLPKTLQHDDQQGEETCP